MHTYQRFHCFLFGELFHILILNEPVTGGLSIDQDHREIRIDRSSVVDLRHRSFWSSVLHHINRCPDPVNELSVLLIELAELLTSHPGLASWLGLSACSPQPAAS